MGLGLASAAGAGWVMRGRDLAPKPAPAPVAELTPDRPTAGPPIDATRIQTGRLTVERMPVEVTVVEEDGSVVCQRLPRGVVSVSSLSGAPRTSGVATAQASVPGGVGRYQTAGEDDFLVVPIALPDGAIVTGFTYLYWDDDEHVDGAAYLYRSDDTMMAEVATEGARAEVRAMQTEKITARKVDNSGFAYVVFMQTSAKAGANLVPIAATVSYRMP
jgi:hypothetical protein